VTQLCGHKLRTGRGCRQPVNDASGRCAAGHQTAPKDQDGESRSGACGMAQTGDGWVCRAHDLGSEQWRVAMALGALPPCKIPGPPGGRENLAADAETPLRRYYCYH